MYAIETKKRKFDRILETIKDHANPQPSAPTTPARAGVSSTSSMGNTSIKKRRLDPLTMAPKSSSTTSFSKTANYLPASREAFLERLETFAPITKWHVPSTEDISAAAWAKRGWCCVRTDVVACKACNEQLMVKLDEDKVDTATNSAEQDDDQLDDDLDSSGNLKHQLLVEKYGDMIVTAHAHSCPWRNRGCDASIQRISGLFNKTNTLQSLKARYDSLSKLDIPPVHVPSQECPYRLDDLAEFRFSTDQVERPHLDTLRLASCGWQASPGRQDVTECRACFRSLGLWLYRGDAPAMEKLDAVESHLEYCPWRSPDAQRTEVELEGKKTMVPAWVLVRRAITEATHHPASNGAAGKHHEGSEEVGEEERETKVKELLRRVKQLKKPFNVKALLRKKAAGS